jgi:hypothetical protein
MNTFWERRYKQGQTLRSSTLLILNYTELPIILSVVLRGCETWSLTLREEHRLKVSENGVMGKDIWV